MAYSKAAPKEHPSRTIVKTMQAGAQSGIFPKLILLCGKEDFLIDWSKDYLKEGLLHPVTATLDLSVFSEDSIDLPAIILACDTPPMMSTRKLVIVEESDVFTAQAPRDMSTAEVQKLIDYFPEIPDTTMLVFTSKKPNKTKALYKAIAKSGIIYDFTSLDDGTLGGWMAKRFSAAGKNAGRTDMVNFAKICGYGDPERDYTLFNLENDLKLIFSLYDKNDLSLSDMLSAVQGQDEVNSFKLLDCAFSGNKGKALEILHASIDTQAPSKEMGVVLSFLGLLISQLEIMTEGLERTEEGQSSYEIIKEMGVNEYRYKKAMASCRGKRSSDLRRTLNKAFEIEKNMKSGNMDGRLGLELFIAEI
ncbi:MAG: DNA polymerase III subunit delta [Firmicutes bacterium]|nr:DNA polymerase III subunit delta [Bacillota bacterium]